MFCLFQVIFNVFLLVWFLSPASWKVRSELVKDNKRVVFQEPEECE